MKIYIFIWFLIFFKEECIILAEDICNSNNNNNNNNQIDSNSSKPVNRKTPLRNTDEVGNNLEYKWYVTYNNSRCASKKQVQRCNLMAWEATRNLQKFLANYKFNPDNPNVEISTSMFVPGMEFIVNLTVVNNGTSVRSSKFVLSENKTSASINPPSERYVKSGRRGALVLGKLDIHGPNKSYADVDLYLYADVIVCFGNVVDVKMDWQIYTDTGQLVSNLSYTGMQLLIPSRTFVGGMKYRVRAAATLNSTIIDTKNHILEIGKKGLSIRMNVKVLTVGINEPVKIIATIYNPDNVKDLDLDWSCKYENKDCTNFEANTVILYNTKGFSKPGIYKITGTIKGAGVLKSETCLVNVTDKVSRSIEVYEIPFLADASKHIEIIAKVTKLVKGCTGQWISLKENGYNMITLEYMPGYPGIIPVNYFEDTFLRELSEPGSGIVDREFSLVIPPAYGSWPGLEGDKSYLIRLEVSCPQEPHPFIVDIPLRTNASPRLQALQVNPVSGLALSTKFNFETEQGLDAIDDYPLLYKYGYILKNKHLYFAYGNDLLRTGNILPYSENGLQTILDCCDNKGSCTFIKGPILNIQIPNSLSESEESQLRNHFLKLLSDGNYMFSITYAIMLLETYDQFANDLLKEDMEKFIITNINYVILNMINLISISDMYKYPANELLKSIIVLADFVKFPEEFLMNIVKLRMAVSDVTRRERIVTETENIEHLLDLINIYNNKNIKTFSVEDVSDYLETLELVIRQSDIATTIENQKKNVITVLNRYLGRLCSLMFDGQRIKIDLQTMFIVLEQLSNNHFNSFVEIPNVSNKFNSSIKVKFINEWEEYTNGGSLCVAKGILNNYLFRNGYVYLVDVYDANSYGKFQAGADLKNYAIFELPNEMSHTCMVFDDNKWNGCKRVKQNKNSVLCECNKLGYYSTDVNNFEEISTTPTIEITKTDTPKVSSNDNESPSSNGITTEITINETPNVTGDQDTESGFSSSVTVTMPPLFNSELPVNFSTELNSFGTTLSINSTSITNSDITNSDADNNSRNSFGTTFSLNPISSVNSEFNNSQNSFDPTISINPTILENSTSTENTGSTPTINSTTLENPSSAIGSNSDVPDSLGTTNSNMNTSIITDNGDNSEIPATLNSSGTPISTNTTNLDYNVSTVNSEIPHNNIGTTISINTITSGNSLSPDQASTFEISNITINSIETTISINSEIPHNNIETTVSINSITSGNSLSPDQVSTSEISNITVNSIEIPLNSRTFENPSSDSANDSPNSFGTTFVMNSTISENHSPAVISEITPQNSPGTINYAGTTVSINIITSENASSSDEASNSEITDNTVNSVETTITMNSRTFENPTSDSGNNSANSFGTTLVMNTTIFENPSPTANSEITPHNSVETNMSTLENRVSIGNSENSSVHSFGATIPTSSNPSSILTTDERDNSSIPASNTRSFEATIPSDAGSGAEQQFNNTLETTMPSTDFKNSLPIVNNTDIYDQRSAGTTISMNPITFENPISTEHADGTINSEITPQNTVLINSSTSNNPSSIIATDGISSSDDSSNNTQDFFTATIPSIGGNNSEPFIENHNSVGTTNSINPTLFDNSTTKLDRENSSETPQNSVTILMNSTNVENPSSTIESDGRDSSITPFINSTILNIDPNNSTPPDDSISFTPIPASNNAEDESSTPYISTNTPFTSSNSEGSTSNSTRQSTSLSENPNEQTTSAVSNISTNIDVTTASTINVEISNPSSNENPELITGNNISSTINLNYYNISEATHNNDDDSVATMPTIFSNSSHVTLTPDEENSSLNTTTSENLSMVNNTDGISLVSTISTLVGVEVTQSSLEIKTTTKNTDISTIETSDADGIDKETQLTSTDYSEENNISTTNTILVNTTEDSINNINSNVPLGNQSLYETPLSFEESPSTSSIYNMTTKQLESRSMHRLSTETVENFSQTLFTEQDQEITTIVLEHSTTEENFPTTTVTPKEFHSSTQNSESTTFNIVQVSTLSLDSSSQISNEEQSQRETVEMTTKFNTEDQSNTYNQISSEISSTKQLNNDSENVSVATSEFTTLPNNNQHTLVVLTETTYQAINNQSVVEVTTQFNNDLDNNNENISVATTELNNNINTLVTETDIQSNIYSQSTSVMLTDVTDQLDNNNQNTTVTPSILFDVSNNNQNVSLMPTEPSNQSNNNGITDVPTDIINKSDNYDQNPLITQASITNIINNTQNTEVITSSTRFGVTLSHNSNNDAHTGDSSTLFLGTTINTGEEETTTRTINQNPNGQSPILDSTQNSITSNYDSNANAISSSPVPEVRTDRASTPTPVPSTAPNDIVNNRGVNISTLTNNTSNGRMNNSTNSSQPETLSLSENRGSTNRTETPILSANILSASSMSKNDEISLIIIGVSIFGIVLLGIVGAVMNRVKRERTIETSDNADFPRYANIFHQDTLESAPR